jgi:ABC-2 type transport system permease protein
MDLIFTQATKEWAELKRDKLSLALALLLPLISLLLFGFGVRMQSHDIPVIVQDFSNTSISRALIERIEGTIILKQKAFPLNANVKKELDSGRAKAAVIIPADFARGVLNGNGSKVDVLIDGTDIINARLIEASIDASAKYVLRSSGLDRAPTPVKSNIRIWFNPGLRETFFIVPGVFGIILWMFPSLLACVACAREKEQGTVVQAYSADIGAAEFVIGKAIVYIFIGLCQAALILTLGYFLFGLTFAGNPLTFLLTVPIFVSCSVLFGLAVGSWANSQTTAVQGVSSLGFFTCLLLSGFVYPLSNIPFPLSLFSYLVPGRYFIDASRDAFERGMGFKQVWMDPLILSVYTLVLFVIAWVAWRRMKFQE